MIEKTKTNPLAHLAWLGILGVIGIFLYTPPMIVFLLFFFFLTYRKMPADELFWDNVRKAGSRAFAVYIGFDIIAVIFLVARSLLLSFDRPEYAHIEYMAGDQLMTIDLHYFTQVNIIAAAFVLGMIISLCVFFFTLIRINRREKKFLDDTAASTIDTAVIANDNN